MSPRLKSLRLQPRDFTVLQELFESRLMTLSHVATLHFDGRTEYAKKRIAKLKDAGFIAERPRRRFEPSVLSLTRRAFQVLHDRGYLVEYPELTLHSMEKRSRVSELTLRHELAVMDVKVAMVKAIRPQPSLHVERFCTWPKLYEFSSRIFEDGSAQRRGLIQADGYLRISQQANGIPREVAFYLEIDRGTERLQSLVDRAVAYLDHYRSGGYSLWRGAQREEYKRYPFRVLGVFTSERRLRNIAERLLVNDPPVRHQFLLANFAEVIHDPLGPIWSSPADCQSLEMANESTEERSSGNWSRCRRFLIQEDGGRLQYTVPVASSPVA
jgi:hypothetical protein